MAWNEGPKFRAGGTIVPCTAVKIDTAADNQVVACGANGRAIGIAQEGQKRTPGLPGSDTAIAAEINDEIDVFFEGDICQGSAGAAITRGAELESDANGQLILAAGAGQHNIIAQALESASGINVKIRVVVTIYQKTI